MRSAARWLAVLPTLLVGWACAGRQLPPEQITHPGQLLFNGQVRPDINCYKCHDGDASGTGRGPDLGERVPEMSDGEIVHAIERGPSIMPSFDDELSSVEKQQIVAWLRERFPRT